MCFFVCAKLNELRPKYFLLCVRLQWLQNKENVAFLTQDISHLTLYFQTKQQIPGWVYYVKKPPI